jgi:hypothetical protein
VDEQLFNTCWDILGTKSELAAIVYYRTTTLGARLDLVAELVLSALPKPERKNGGHDSDAAKLWRELQSDIRDLLSERTRIAHYPVESAFERTPRPDDPLAPWPTLLEDVSNNAYFQLCVSRSERLRGKHDTVKPLTVDDLSEHCQIVQLQSRLLHKFRAGTLAAYLK